MDGAPGLFGKVSTLGDFVSRRLPPPFIAVWDAWLQAGLQGSRAALGAAWLDTYLNGPIWRFALAPGVCDDQAWAGILMPSVDRVGRHFPLTLAAGAPGALDLQQWLGESAAWFDQLEELALGSLDAHFQLEALDAALLEMAPLPAAAAVGVAGQFGLRLPLGAVEDIGTAVSALGSAALAGQSVWWTDGSARVEPCAILCRGLPAPAAFTQMLAGA
jgi:type VI secretion system protein ImpM